MPLTTEDLRQIKNVVIEVVDERVEPRFSAIDKRFDKVEANIEHLAVSTQRQFAAVDEKLEVMNGKIDNLQEGLDSVKEVVADHHFRITTIERKAKAA